ncbi:hypothetical protein QL285_044801 [Trifolium repens]|nr:hypothetical protein QL285_044801 [Trifolium repens]
MRERFSNGASQGNASSVSDFLLCVHMRWRKAMKHINKLNFVMFDTISIFIWVGCDVSFQCFSLYVINTLIPPNLGTLVEDLYSAGVI